MCLLYTLYGKNILISDRPSVQCSSVQQHESACTHLAASELDITDWTAWDKNPIQIPCANRCKDNISFVFERCILNSLRRTIKHSFILHRLALTKRNSYQVRYKATDQTVDLLQHNNNTIFVRYKPRLSTVRSGWKSPDKRELLLKHWTSTRVNPVFCAFTHTSPTVGNIHYQRPLPPTPTCTVHTHDPLWSQYKQRPLPPAHCNPGYSISYVTMVTGVTPHRRCTRSQLYCA